MSDRLNILFLCKRFYMSKDVMLDRYGRLFQFPYQLAQRGHQVNCLVCDYHLKSRFEGPLSQDGMNWISIPAARPDRIWQEAGRLAQATDVIVASSDCLQVVLAHHMARRHHKPMVADLYDNYESFGLSRIPGLKGRFRKALHQADAISCVGDELKQMVEQAYRPDGLTTTLHSTIGSGQFFPLPRSEARVALDLPEAATLVGLCGGLTPNRGIGNFYRAAEKMWEEGADFTLVLAGTPDPAVPPPYGDKTRLLGNLPFEQMNTFYNAMDLNVLQYLNNDFGRYCYPQKLDEIIASGAPLVAADVGEIGRRFIQVPQLLFDPDSTESIVSAVSQQLASPASFDRHTESWEEVGAALEAVLLEVTGDSAQ